MNLSIRQEIIRQAASRVQLDHVPQQHQQRVAQRFRGAAAADPSGPEP